MSQGAAGIIFKDGQSSVLLVQRSDNGVWVLPGGGLDPHEAAADAVVREIQEETGLQAKVKRKVGEYTPINRLTSFAHVFECEIVGGEIRGSDETRGVAYFPIESLPEPFFPLHGDWIADALLNHPEVLKKPLERITYTEVIKYLVLHPIEVMRFVWTRIKLRL